MSKYEFNIELQPGAVNIEHVDNYYSTTVVEGHLGKVMKERATESVSFDKDGNVVKEQEL